MSEYQTPNISAVTATQMNLAEVQNITIDKLSHRNISDAEWTNENDGSHNEKMLMICIFLIGIPFIFCCCYLFAFVFGRKPPEPTNNRHSQQRLMRNSGNEAYHQRSKETYL